MNIRKKALTLIGKIQHYEWGGYTFIPELLEMEHIKNENPFAEYWMGAHISAPSEIIEGEKSETLTELIKIQPLEVLGEKIYNEFHGLPYLFKVLDVRAMLSIQVHPSKSGAETGFAEEEAAGIALNALTRNYKDRNHKPEVMVALSDFWLLHGFKSQRQIQSVLHSVQGFNRFIPVFESEGFKGLYEQVMTMPQQEVDHLLRPLIQQEIKQKLEGKLTRSNPGWWIAKHYDGVCPEKEIDRGIFSIYFFNIVNLKKDQAIFQDAGVPHAYLEGQNIEVMANSDNVLRGGLTSKYVDVQELMKHTLFEAVEPVVLKGVAIDKETFYDCTVPDFGVSRIELEKGDSYHSTSYGLQILLVISGGVIVKGEKTTIASKGQSLALFDGCEYSLTSLDKAVLFKAFVPK